MDDDDHRKLLLGDPQEPLRVEQVALIARAGCREATAPTLSITPAARERITHATAIVDAIVAEGRVVYGINTGFGAFKDRVLPASDLVQLQANLINSQTVGVGPALSREEVRAMMLARAATLALGYSGLRASTLDLLVEMINRGVHPVVPSQGSVGASGDLAPLSHMAAVMMGKGQAEYGGAIMSGAEALAAAGLEPVVFGPKEGLALCNGTSQMAGLLSLATHDADTLSRAADICGALSFEALGGLTSALDRRIHLARRQPGQIAAAANLRSLLAGSELVWQDGPVLRSKGEDHFGQRAPLVAHKVQDAYSLRCMPQVHGPLRDMVGFVRGIAENELNAAVDNPLVFGAGEIGADMEAEVISGGNFHGMPVAVAADVLGIPLCAVASISERRQFRLLDPAAHGGILPPFLAANGGLNSGFMMVQYTAAALVSENKSLAHPASVDSIPTSANQEDHVSMGPIAARHARAIVRNTTLVLALELLTACQALDFRLLSGGPQRLGRGTAVAYNMLRERVPFLQSDETMTPHIAWATELIESGRLVQEVESAIS